MGRQSAAPCCDRNEWEADFPSSHQDTPARRPTSGLPAASAATSSTRMKTRFSTICTFLLIGLLAGCSKPAVPPAAPKAPPAPKPVTVTVVPELERSSHFLAVQKHLDLGGPIYAYVDVDGDAQKLATNLQTTFDNLAASQPQAARFLKQDYPALMRTLGLTDIRAFGLSSIPDGTGFFQNKVFVYIPGPRHGLLAGLGGAAAPFARVSKAPADADLYFESEMDLPQVYTTVKTLVAQVGGAQASAKMEGRLTSFGQSVAWPFLDLIRSWKGHVSMVLRFDRTKTVQIPPGSGAVIPSPSLVLSVEGIGPFVEQGLAHSPFFTSHQEGALKVFEPKQALPMDGLKPVIVIDGTTAHLATSLAFLQECLAPKASLAQSPAFKTALAHLGSEGNALTYVSPNFFNQLHRIESLNPNLPEAGKRSLRFMFMQVPHVDRPLISIRSNLSDGILIRSYWNRSLKQDVAMAAMYNPVSIGFLAAMAIPAFQKVRQASQEKAVLNNLRQLSAASDQYFLEHGVSTATYDDLVGPDKYIKRLIPVAGENYRSLTFQEGVPLRLPVPGLRKIVTYSP